MSVRFFLDSVKNIRTLGGYVTENGVTGNCFYRSALPYKLSEKDEERLKAAGISLAIDLRSESEARLFPSGYDVPFLTYRIVPLEGYGGMPLKGSDMPQFYMNMASHGDSLKKVFALLAANKGAALFHCTAGKDRTGLVAAILLMLAGAEDCDVASDYCATYPYYYDEINAFIAANPQMDAAVGIPLPVHILGFIELFRKKYSGAENYLKFIGLTDAEIAALRNKMFD